MTSRELARAVEAAVASCGEEAVTRALEDLVQDGRPEEHVLTVVGNTGVHEIPPEYRRGVVYAASHGNWSANSQDEVVQELKGILTRLVRQLRSQPWKSVYFIPTGHPVLSIHIKTMVYRVLRLNTIDLYYKDGRYYEVDIDHRELAIGSAHSRGSDG